MAHDIVIVDDDPDVREILTAILETLDVPVRQAANGFEALNLVMNDPPLAIVLDLSMPHMNGRDVLNQLRNDPTTCDIPVLIFTAQRITAHLSDELGVPLSMIAGKGRLSMTDFRALILGLIHEAKARVAV